MPTIFLKLHIIILFSHHINYIINFHAILYQFIVYINLTNILGSNVLGSLYHIERVFAVQVTLTEFPQ